MVLSAVKPFIIHGGIILKVKLITLALLVGILTGCSTTGPIRSDVSFPTGGEYTVLGRVTIETSSDYSGYMKLLEAAKDQYPKTDDVVNIVVDRKVTWLLLLPINYNIIMSGIAISYD